MAHGCVRFFLFDVCFLEYSHSAHKVCIFRGGYSTVYLDWVPKPMVDTAVEPDGPLYDCVAFFFFFRSSETCMYSSAVPWSCLLNLVWTVCYSSLFYCNCIEVPANFLGRVKCTRRRDSCPTFPKSLPTRALAL